MNYSKHVEHGPDADLIKTTGQGVGPKRTRSYRRGYRHEADMAKRLNGQRVGLTGKATIDVDAGWLAIECKERQTLPAWIQTAMSKARAKASDDQLAVVILHELGKRHDNDLVVLRLCDFEEHFGETEER